MASTPRFETTFADLEKVGADLGKRLGVGGRANDPANLGQQKVAAAQSKLDGLHQQRARLEADIAAAQRDLHDVKRLAQTVARPSAKTVKAVEETAPKVPLKAKAAPKAK